MHNIYEAGINWEELSLNPIFKPIKYFFEFYLLGIGFVGQPDFQRVFLKTHPEFKNTIERYNLNVNLEKDGSNIKTESKEYWITLGRMMSIAIFNILESSEYNSILNQEDLFKFTKHLRNGSAHNNKFNISPPVQRPIIWRDKIIDNNLNGTPVFTDFFNPILLIFLMKDISDLIAEKEALKTGR